MAPARQRRSLSDRYHRIMIYHPHQSPYITILGKMHPKTCVRPFSGRRKESDNMGQLRTRKRGKYWEWSFEEAKINGKRNPISKSGYRTKADPKQMPRQPTRRQRRNTTAPEGPLRPQRSVWPTIWITGITTTSDSSVITHRWIMSGSSESISSLP